MPFKRMIDSVVCYVESSGLDELINIQGGTYDGVTSLSNINLFKYASQDVIDDYIRQSRLVVTHGGTGSIIGALGEGRKVIVMPRLCKYSEHNDDHQVEMAELFETAGCVVYWRDNESFSDVLKKIDQFDPVAYESCFEGLKDSILKDISSFMNE